MWATVAAMIEAFVVSWGYWAIGVGTFFEGETVLLVAGAMAHRGLLSLPTVVLAAFVGSVAGDQLWFLIGRRFGREFIAARPRLSRHAKRVEAAMRRHGTPFVMGFRFIYGLRTVTPVLLGASGYPLRRFVALNIAGAALWAITFGALGWGVGAVLSRALGRVTHVEEALLISALLATGLWALSRTKHRES